MKNIWLEMIDARDPGESVWSALSKNFDLDEDEVALELEARSERGAGCRDYDDARDICLDKEEQEAGGDFHVGDRVIYKGKKGSVTRIGYSDLSIRFDDGREMDIDIGDIEYGDLLHETETELESFKHESVMQALRGWYAKRGEFDTPDSQIAREILQGFESATDAIDYIHDFSPGDIVASTAQGFNITTNDIRWALKVLPGYHKESVDPIDLLLEGASIDEIISLIS